MEKNPGMFSSKTFHCRIILIFIKSAMNITQCVLRNTIAMAEKEPVI